MEQEVRLLEQLKLLTTSQFEELLWRLYPEIDTSHVRQAAATPAQMGMDLISLLRQRGALGLLRQELDGLEWFKQFCPHGVYPVGEELLRREEAREQQAMEEARVRGEDPEAYRVTPEKFYAFRPEAQWLGVFRGWDCPRSFHAEFLERVLQACQGGRRCPAAAIRGPGGSGKSVALRRLGLELSRQGHAVWWVEDPEVFVAYGLSQLRGAGEGSQVLLLDEVQRLGRDESTRLQRTVSGDNSLVLVVAGRELPAGFQARVGTGAGLFVPDEKADQAAILNKMAQVMPAWAGVARALAAEPLRGARLIRLLVVLARGRVAPRDLEELEATFLEILADDLNKIDSALPGLAGALLDAALMRQAGRDMSRETVIRLAEHHRPGGRAKELLETVSGNLQWELLRPLLSHVPDYDTIRFHHDELADGLLRAGEGELLGPGARVDDAWKRAAVGRIVSVGSMHSSSSALGWLFNMWPSLIDHATVVSYIRQLLARGNGHHSYLMLIVDERLTLQQEERLELLLRAARVAPTNIWLWGPVRRWIARRFDGEAAARIFESLWAAGASAPPVLAGLLAYSPPAKSRALARQWLEREGAPPEVVCRCLEVLGWEGKEAAQRLVEREGAPPEVVCRCLEVLGPEGKEAARRLLEREGTSFQVVCRCLEVLGPERKEAARRLLEREGVCAEVVCRCLEVLGRERKEAARRLLEREGVPAEVVCRCLEVLGRRPRRRRGAWSSGWR